MKRMKYQDSLAAVVSGVSCLVSLCSLLHCGCYLLPEREALWTTIRNLLVFLMHPTLGSVQLSRSGNSCPELQTQRVIFNCVWSGFISKL